MSSTKKKRKKQTHFRVENQTQIYTKVSKDVHKMLCADAQFQGMTICAIVRNHLNSIYSRKSAA